MIEVYSTQTCPRCKLLKERLNSKNIAFKENKDEEEMLKLGFTSVPMVRTEDNKLLDFGQAISWINSL
jgi:glutaredoxin